MEKFIRLLRLVYRGKAAPQIPTPKSQYFMIYGFNFHLISPGSSRVTVTHSDYVLHCGYTVFPYNIIH